MRVPTTQRGRILVPSMGPSMTSNTPLHKQGIRDGILIGILDQWQALQRHGGRHQQAPQTGGRDPQLPTQKGIPIDRVDTHSLRGGGADALALSGYSDTQIQKMGRWRGATFKEYIREELTNYSDGMSTAMRMKFNFMNIAGNAYRDITDTVLTMEYNTEYLRAAAA